MKTLGRLLVLLALVLSGVSVRAAEITIMVGDNYYLPQTVTIHTGDIVTWQYQGGVNSHPTASDNSTWTTFTINSANLTKSLTFNTAGTFPYHCQFHGAPGIGMYGVITVATALAVLPTQLASAAFRVYPNPASDVVSLVVSHEQARAHNTIQVVNVLGRVVRVLEVRPELADQELAMPVGDLPMGIYFYRLLVNNELVAIQRLTVVR